jgi:hypothetical protein
MLRLLARNTGETFDVNPDIKLSIERNNVFFEETSAFSLPFVLPCTPTNLKLLNFPHQLARIDYAETSIPVILNLNSFQYIGVLKILSVLEKEIHVNVQLDNANLYAAIGDRELPRLFSDVIFDNAPAGYTREQKIAWWLDILHLIMLGHPQQNLPFYIFSAYCQPKNIINNNTPLYFVNKPYTDDGRLHYGPDNVDFYPLRGYRSYNATVYKSNGDIDMVIPIPVGYDTTPFLQLSWTLHKIFELLGYALVENAFDTDTDLSKIAILNNTRDSLMAGRIYASHLLPDITISDFLTSIRKMYGCEFILQPDNKTVEILFLKDILSDAPHDNFTPLLGQKNPNIEYQSKKTLKLLADHQFDTIDFVNFDIFQDAVKQLGEYTSVVDFASISAIEAPKLYFSQLELIYRSTFRNQLGEAEFENWFVNRIFDYYNNNSNLEAEEISMSVKNVGINNYNIGNYIYGCCPVISEKRDKTTAIQVGNRTEESDQKFDMFLCFYNGRYINGGIDTYTYFGTPYRYDGSGNPIGNLNLVWEGENGLYNQYLKKYDDSLRKGMHRLSMKLNLSTEKVMNYNFYKQVIIKGVRCLPVKLQYEITNNNIRIVNAEFLTV